MLTAQGAARRAAHACSREAGVREDAQPERGASEALRAGQVDDAARREVREREQRARRAVDTQRHAPLVVEQDDLAAGAHVEQERVARAGAAPARVAEQQGQPRDESALVAGEDRTLPRRFGRAVHVERRGRVVLAETAGWRRRGAEHEVGRDVHEARAAAGTGRGHLTRQVGVEARGQLRFACAVAAARERRDQEHDAWRTRFDECSHVPGHLAIDRDRLELPAGAAARVVLRRSRSEEHVPLAPDTREFVHERAAEETGRSEDEETLHERLRAREPNILRSMSESSATKATKAAFERALVVANPIAGRGRAEGAARALCAELEARGIAPELFLTHGRGDAREHVRAQGRRFDVVVSVGGDGTLGEVLAGVGEQKLPVAQLPFGTANVLAKDARLPRTPRTTAALIASGRTTPLDTALVNGRLSFLCVGIGFDGACVAEVERRRRGPISKLDYVRAGLSVVRNHRPARVRLSIDGRAIEREFGFVLISNVREYGAVFRLARDSRRDDGQVEVYGLERASRLDLLRFGARAMFASQPGGDVFFAQGKTVRVEAEPDDAWQLDGDFGGHGSFTYDLSGPVQRLMAP